MFDMFGNLLATPGFKRCRKKFKRWFDRCVTFTHVTWRRCCIGLICHMSVINVSTGFKTTR